MHTKNHSFCVNPDVPVGTIVHLGAGACTELDDYLASQPTHLLLVEADPQLAEILEVRTVDFPQVDVVHKAVAGQSGPVTFYRYNLPDVGSLHQADSALLELFPGLKTMQELYVEAVTPFSLLQSLKLGENQANCLIIDLPGEELPVLKALQQADQLHLFEQIKLHGGLQSLYKNGAPAAIVLQWLQDQGFDLLIKNDSHDPDRPCWTLNRNKLQLQYRELRQQMAQLTQVNDERLVQLEQLTVAWAELEKIASSCQQQRDHEKERADNKQKELDQKQATIMKLEQQLSELKQRQPTLDEKFVKAKAENSKLKQQMAHLTKVNDELRVQLEQLTTARNEQVKMTTDQQKQIEQINDSKAEAEKLAQDRQQQIEQLTKARDEQSKLMEERQVRIQQLIEEGENKASLLTERQAQLEQLTKACDEQARLAEERNAQIQQLTQIQLVAEPQAQIEQFERRVQQLQFECDKRAERESNLMEELNEARQTTSLSVRMQALREADLNDLQSRYQMALSTQDSQHQLLIKLSERLAVASDYFHQVTLDESTPLKIETENKKRKGKKRSKRAKKLLHRKHAGKAR